MKVDRRVVLSSAVVLGVAALIAGSTIAYFTDKDTKENQFTVGDVDLTLYESQLHRMNSGRQGLFDAMSSDPDYCTYTGTDIDGNTGAGPQPYNPITGKGGYESAKYCTPHMNANEGNIDTISAIKNGHTGRTWGYKDSTIISDAESYKAEDDPATTGQDESGYFTRVSKNIVPGQYIRKFSYVTNNNTNGNGSDAYVLIRYMVPKEYAGVVELELPSSAYLEDKNVQTTTHGNGYFTLVEKNGDTYAQATIADKTALKSYSGHEETVDNKQYMVYSAVTTDVVKPGEMTFWSPVNTVRLKTTASDNTGPLNADPLFSIKVDAQAIQAKTFTDAIDAINHLQ